MITQGAKILLSGMIKNIDKKLDDDIKDVLLKKIISTGISVMDMGTGNILKLKRGDEIVSIDNEVMVINAGGLKIVHLQTVINAISNLDVVDAIAVDSIVDIKSMTDISSNIDVYKSTSIFTGIAGKIGLILGYSNGTKVFTNFTNACSASYNGLCAYIQIGNLLYKVPYSVIKGVSDYKSLAEVEMSNLVDRFLSDYNNNLKRNLEKVTSDYEGAVSNFLRCKKILDDLLESKNKSDKRANVKNLILKDLEFIKSYNNIEDIILLGGLINVHTGRIFIKYDGKLHNVGKYNIRIDLINSNVKIVNRLIDNDSDYHHPHIQGNGSLCTGDFSSILSKNLSELNIVGLVDIGLEFLGAYNASSPYISIYDYDERREDTFNALYIKEGKDVKEQPEGANSSEGSAEDYKD